jgi:hypothetical protein
LPNDPEFPYQWSLHNSGQTGGAYDADIDLPAAWVMTTGSMATIVAVLDSGVDYADPDLYLNIWLNPGEIPDALAGSLSDTDGDTLLTFRDLNAVANTAYVTDLNANGYIDGGDLLRDARWANGMDDDGNGKVDDLVGWDTHDNDNDPAPTASHGTDMSAHIGAITNNALGKAGINWAVRLMPIRVQFDTVNRVNTNAAHGLDYAVAMGATISNNRTDNGYSQEMFDAIARARDAGHLFMAAAGNFAEDMDSNPHYPAAYDLDNIISVAALDASDKLTSVSNWGLQNVDLGAPALSPGTSNSTATTTGVAALLKSLHPDWNYVQIKSRILASVDPVPSLSGKTVTGGRLNAARALAITSISVSEPSILEGTNGGATQLVFAVTRFGDDTGTLVLNWSTANGTAVAGTDYVAASGQITFNPSGINTQIISVNVQRDLNPEPDETMYVQLTLASGEALLADDIGQGMILNDDLTKFYVVNDATTNQNYEYTSEGIAVESYNLRSGNTSPRGAASTFTGDKVWVADSNRNLYVYNPSGALLGSWTAGSLQSNAQVEGVATNGTDVWLVDAKVDKVFRYTGAASRLSGNQNAASSFSLAAGNASPKDIVTDGVHLWVVNDSTTDKVFKYTMTGSLVGSWTISTSGASSPTGLTIDPSNVSDIWIVDSGADAVFQYTAAASKTSGSQSASASFQLAAGNTNPQGIADPPAPQAGAAIQGRPRRARRSAESARVTALDNYLASKLPDDSTQRSVTIADRFVNTLFDLGYSRATLRSLRRTLR